MDQENESERERKRVTASGGAAEGLDRSDTLKRRASQERKCGGEMRELVMRRAGRHEERKGPFQMTLRGLCGICACVGKTGGGGGGRGLGDWYENESVAGHDVPAKKEGADGGYDGWCIITQGR